VPALSLQMQTLGSAYSAAAQLPDLWTRRLSTTCASCTYRNAVEDLSAKKSTKYGSGRRIMGGLGLASSIFVGGASRKFRARAHWARSDKRVANLSCQASWDVSSSDAADATKVAAEVVKFAGEANADGSFALLFVPRQRAAELQGLAKAIEERLQGVPLVAFLYTGQQVQFARAGNLQRGRAIALALEPGLADAAGGEVAVLDSLNDAAQTVLMFGDPSTNPVFLECILAALNAKLPCATKAGLLVAHLQLQTCLPYTSATLASSQEALQFWQFRLLHVVPLR